MLIRIATSVVLDRLDAPQCCAIELRHFKLDRNCFWVGYRALAPGLPEQGGWLQYLIFPTAADGFSIALGELAYHWRESERLFRAVWRLRRGLPRKPRYEITPWQVIGVLPGMVLLRAEPGHDFETSKPREANGYAETD